MQLISQYVHSPGLSAEQSTSCLSRSHITCKAKVWMGNVSRMDSTKCMKQSSDDSTGTRKAGKLMVVIDKLWNKRFRKIQGDNK